MAAAHFPAELDVDLQPGNAENFVDLDDPDHATVLPSEFLSDGERTTFDPTGEDVRYRFGSRSALDDGEGARPVDGGEVVERTHGHGENAETVEALQLRFPVADTGLEPDDDTAWLFWERDESGEHGLSGFDTLSVYGRGMPSERGLADLHERLLELLRED
ncbi:hypothetical protein [Halomarina litorea]|uniref:hypothetical protein n=1 Tax=Halomarina litorea TaxID=2961595 RepID=UPI0020C3B9CC|nr:hypothetical protein [Halomarina sp. BCD28]